MMTPNVLAYLSIPAYICATMNTNYAEDRRKDKLLQTGKSSARFALFWRLNRRESDLASANSRVVTRRPVPREFARNGAVCREGGDILRGEC